MGGAELHTEEHLCNPESFAQDAFALLEKGTNLSVEINLLLVD